MAPAVVKASSLMPIFVPKERQIWTPWTPWTPGNEFHLGPGDFTLEGNFRAPDPSKIPVVGEFRITKGVNRHMARITVPAGGWSHIAVTSNGFYRNGVLIPVGPDAPEIEALKFIRSLAPTKA